MTPPPTSASQIVPIQHLTDVSVSSIIYAQQEVSLPVTLYGGVAASVFERVKQSLRYLSREQMLDMADWLDRAAALEIEEWGTE